VPDELNQLAPMHQQGALTEDEFATAKARLLSGKAPCSRRT
jgi:Short C-terminal domain